MLTIRRPSGLQITLPETYQVLPTTALQRRRRARSQRRGFSGGPVPQDDNALAAEIDVLLSALQSQQIDLVDDLEVNAPEAPHREAQRRRARAVEGIEIDVDLTENESAVVLLEQEGVYSWQLPTKSAVVRTPAARRSGHRARSASAPRSESRLPRKRLRRIRRRTAALSIA